MRIHLLEKKLFIFDLDGTIVDAYKAIYKSVNFTLKKLGYKPVSFRKVKKSVGKGDRLFIKSFFPANQVSKALKIYREHHKKILPLYTKVLPYAKSFLELLKKDGKITAIASNRPRYFTNIILKKLNLKKFFDFVLCADQIGFRKPSPQILFKIMRKFKVDKDDTIFIGDMTIDLETAKRAKVFSIFIKGGSSTVAQAKPYKNKKIFSSIKQIIDFYKKEKCHEQ
ncbi:MAG: HAD family hydrolase [Candidatus Omnitrophica bacterium]|nr:HAD family hydrolase [Candidatus Omnitrophota bacterium]MCM8831251.1 HAD family hydrolase [Candidatus Omnitrophota bacterium]